MEADERRRGIRDYLEQSEEAVVARTLASKFNVSRQVIVGDIALLRAAGAGIVSTPKGYIMRSQIDEGVSEAVVCQHSPDDTKEELYAIVDLGGEVIDVTVEHPIYGLLKGDLNISSRLEADEFISKVQDNPSALLSSLTEGLHIHTIKAKNEDRLQKIKKVLESKGFLYQ
ncbi:transcription repressor NadR [Alkalibacterium indicireducens]|uniref:Transcription repressor NadR n=1 Tax=Alkalibacterium indicireducens TaxID=398758 RepID=A0ABP3KL61_9LACT